MTFGKGTQRPAIDNNYKPCDYGSITRKANGDQVLVLEWNDLRFWEEDSIVSVKVSIELPGDNGIAEWKIFVSNRFRLLGIVGGCLPGRQWFSC